MPEYIRALVVILTLATAIFSLIKPQVADFGITEGDFLRRRNAWYLVTLAGFLSQSYWIFAAIVIFVVRHAAKRETNKVALFFFLCLALPQIKFFIPGFAGINYIFDIDYLRLLTLLLLLPVCMDEWGKKEVTQPSVKVIDTILALYIVYCFTLQCIYLSPTDIMRYALAWTIDVIIPYYSLSRYLRQVTQFTDVFFCFAVAAMIASLIGVFENVRGWILYASAGAALGVAWDPGYLPRGESIRAMATSGQPIIFGYVTAIALGCYAFLKINSKHAKLYLLGLFIVIAGHISPLSKGPWVGAVGIGIVLLLTGKNWTKNLVKASLLFLPLSLLLASTEAGLKVISYLPFVGDLDTSGGEYRQRVFDESMAIILDNPWFGSVNYRSKLEDLRQGQGLIDLVNHYIGIALSTGLVGLSLFVGFFALILYSLNASRLQKGLNLQEGYLGRSLLAIIVGILIIISTVSPIFHLPFFYWAFGALSVAYIRMANHNRTQLGRATAIS